MKAIKLTFVLLLAVTFNAIAQKPSPELLDPTNHSLVLIDHEGQMAFAVNGVDPVQLRNNVGLVSGTAKIFNIPTVVTTVAEESFSGPVFPEIIEFFPNNKEYIDRTTMNTWEDENAYKAITGKGKKKIVMAGLWTSVCVVGPVLSAINDGYEVYVITDASGDISQEAHDMAVDRMVQAGVKPITSLQYLLELQRDWARSETYEAVNQLAMRFGGGYGIGIQYARKMLKH
ncbi:Isochorismatase hydrolase [Croceitalea dokdonensis DOKDO 023]|uniref:Isochorismatase hydrolase n=1 Tax=Croceitalea dokdonensis DOKDO 023 TaxID=1300341 RepID=A0A0P7AHA3_9FLAO|nr:hydrolase [Croceitalea dokdonensis]KPM31229.1 Isochorismatase hydrolase [Croceitalea dokdonensis DOKDO 023]